MGKNVKRDIFHFLYLFFLVFLVFLESINLNHFFHGFRNSDEIIFRSKENVIDQIMKKVNKKCINGNTVLFFFGSADEVVRMAPIIKKMMNSNFVPFVISTTNSGSSRDVFRRILSLYDLSDKIDANLRQRQDDSIEFESIQNLTGLTSEILPLLNIIMSKCKPLTTFIEGDSNSAFIGSLSAHYNNVPIAHIGGGFRRYNNEDVNGKFIDNIALFNFVDSEFHKNNIIHEYNDENRVYITGNPIVDSIEHIKSNFPTIPPKLNHILSKESKTEIKQIIYLCLNIENMKQNLFYDNSIQHKHQYERNYIEKKGNVLFLSGIFDALFDVLKENEDVSIVFPIRQMNDKPYVLEELQKALPNSKVYNKLIDHEVVKGKNQYFNRFHLIIEEPLSFVEHVHLMSNSYLVVTQSDATREEAAALRVPCILLRNQTENETTNSETQKMTFTASMKTKMNDTVFSGAKVVERSTHGEIMKTTQLLLSNKEVYEKMTKKANVNVVGKGKAADNIINVLSDFFYK